MRVVSFITHIIFITGFSGPCRLTAQNLVINPGFEIMSSCPDNHSQIERATGWYKPTNGTSDLLSECATGMASHMVKVPNTHAGFQYAHSGTNYAGFYAYAIGGTAFANGQTDTNNREYIQSKLVSPMETGKTYRVSFYLNLGGGWHGNGSINCATDDIGACFSVDPLLRPSPPWFGTSLRINRDPQFKNPDGNYISDTTNWILISGCFTADSAYNYITIGCFKGADIDLIHVNALFPHGDECYYFIDDVSVTAEPGNLSIISGDSIICNGAPALLSVTGNNIQWSNGATTTSIQAEHTGVYTVITYMDGCLYTDTVEVTAADLHPSLGKDQLLCNVPAYPLQAPSDDARTQYTWNTGATSPGITVEQTGIYWVRQQIEQCTATDTVKIELLYQPFVSLGADRILCENEVTVLSSGIQRNDNEITWNTHENTMEIAVDQPGIYHVTATNECGTSADTLTVLDGGNCSCPVYLPNAITADANTLNDKFGVVTGCSFKTFELRIYDRWGQRVFTTVDPLERWQANKTQTGIYTWQLLYTLDNTTVIKQIERTGHVVVLE